MRSIEIGRGKRANYDAPPVAVAEAEIAVTPAVATLGGALAEPVTSEAPAAGGRLAAR